MPLADLDLVQSAADASGALDAPPRRGTAWFVLGGAAVAASLVVAACWRSGLAPSAAGEFAPLLAEAADRTRDGYSVASGVYRQANVESGERLLSVDGPGVGRLVIRLPAVPAFLVGADRVEIDTTWRVEGDDVTFRLLGGRPAHAYRRMLALTLEESTRFLIRGWEADALTLERASDGERFEWRRVEDAPSPDAVEGGTP